MISFEIWGDDGIALIEPNGALDGEAVPALRQALQDAAKLATSHTIAIIDGQVIVFDAVALGAAHHELSEDDCSFVLNRLNHWGGFLRTIPG